MYINEILLVSKRLSDHNRSIFVEIWHTDTVLMTSIL